ncbi:hypothetical protein PB1_03215 [Bacillus methanolicus PB1]|uniref:Uncharacterized protein n=1 Tax=Bacillus methanolicus PB1 TaxID=997296 RepID=I3E5Z5_BACMT|nr:hypothetical protein PB1_03215 [Bacillus methanolicus PB1]
MEKMRIILEKFYIILENQHIILEIAEAKKYHSF